MPEYLAPAVYVEEVDTGSKPIEGVSTSTAGMIGVTERGPVHVPILVTSNGEYQRWFGQMLDPDVFDQRRCYLPHAIEGFFTNGGKRVYVTRVLDSTVAECARRSIVALDDTAPVTTQLLTSAAVGDASIVVVDGTGLTNDTLEIGTGTGAELRTINAALTNANVVALRVPLGYEHDSGQNVDLRAFADDTTAGQKHDTTVQVDASPGTAITLVNVAGFNPALAAGDLLRVGTANVDDEYVVVGSIAGDAVTLRTPLIFPHAATTQVHRQLAGAVAPTTSTMATGASPGDIVVSLASNVGLTTNGSFLEFSHADANKHEFRRVGQLANVPLTQNTYDNYPAGSRVDVVTLGAPAAFVNLMSDAKAGATVITVSDRTALGVGNVLQIGLGPDIEYSEVASLPATLPAPNAGAVVLRSALRIDHLAPVPAAVVRGFAPPTTTTATTLVAVKANANSKQLIASNGGAMAATNIIRVTPPLGAPSYHVVAGPPVALTARNVPLDQPLTVAQFAGAPVVTRTPIAEVRAIDAGAWGNRLQVGVEELPDPILKTTVRAKLTSLSLRLSSAANVEKGTELVITHSGGDTAVKVKDIDRQNDYLITRELTTSLPGTVVAGSAVRSREYRFVVELLRQEDPANPSRNNTAIDREVFSALSLDPRHSRYFVTVIGATWDTKTPGVTTDDANLTLRKGDRRSEGESAYIRVKDLAPGTGGLRIGPHAEYETRADGSQRLILQRLANGDDALGSVSDATYIGQPNANPEARTGLFTLQNIEDISIVAVPGRTSVQMQAALINHCELARYRFAVLDGPPPPTDDLSQVQFQRQQFDTKYAALYHPWLVIPEPYPTNPSAPADYPVPPAGHMIGIYARTDVERGVHKAPANEVVRGVTGLQRILNKEQHDILNPYPVNINVIRDFRSNNRGIRVYGGRVITSDSDWKYVNVRRLLIYIEASIDRGLQWVVFEPNAEPLWARVRRSISNFLTQTWRAGALEGTKVEEAFFVKCDRTTMTQTDIDMGRLIVLVGVAPVKPAEFVIVRIGLWTAHAED
jgi:phage tail sheath protein FI